MDSFSPLTFSSDAKPSQICKKHVSIVTKGLLACAANGFCRALENTGFTVIVNEASSERFDVSRCRRSWCFGILIAEMCGEGQNDARAGPANHQGP